MNNLKFNVLDELLAKLRNKQVIYSSSVGNNYHFVKYSNQRLYFDIPNHNNPKLPNIKSLTKEQFFILLKELKNKKYLITSDFPFKDCRICAFFGFINILYPNTYSKTQGKISLIKNS
jgi:hypothetical protein